jgi:hypothetical protein
MARPRESSHRGGGPVRLGFAVGFLLLATMYLAVTGWRALATLLRPAVGIPRGDAAGVVVALSAATLLGIGLRLRGAPDGALRRERAPWLFAALAGGLTTAAVTVAGAGAGADWSASATVASILASPGTLAVNVVVGGAIVLVAAPAVVAGHAAAHRWFAARD